MKMDKIHELLKAFWMFSWETLTKNIFSQRFKRCQPPKLNGWYPKINKNHQGCYLAFFTHDSNLHLVFWLKSSSCNIFWPKKSTFWNFVIFYNHLHQDLNFGQFDPLAPTPWGTPPDHPPHHLPWCFSYPTSLRMKIFGKILTIFAIFQFWGLYIKNASFWPWQANFEEVVWSEDSEKILADDFFGSYKPNNVSKLSAQAFFAFLGNPEHATIAPL